MAITRSMQQHQQHSDDETLLLMYEVRGHRYFWFWTRSRWPQLVDSLLKLHTRQECDFNFDDFSRVYRAAKEEMSKQ